MSYYSLYFYRFDSNVERSTIMNMISRCEEWADVSLREIKNESNEEKLKIINEVILAERYRKFTDESVSDIVIKLIEYSSNRYLSIVSVVMERHTIREIEAIFDKVTNNLTPVYFGQESSEKESLAFWQSALSEFTLAGKKKYSEKMVRNVDLGFPLKLKNKERLLKLLSDSPECAKAYCSAAVARLMCLVNDSVGLIFEDIHEAGRLSRLPVRVDDTVGTQSGRESLMEYFKDASRKDNIDYKTLVSKTGINLTDAPLFSQSFVHEKSYSECFKRMKVDQLYCMAPLEIANVPLFVTFRFHENEKIIQYEYDSGFFDGINIEGFNEAVCALVDSYIEEAEVEPDVMAMLHKKNDLKEKIDAIKMKFLGDLPIFEGYSKSELARISQKFDIKQAFSQQPVIEKGRNIDRLYFLVYGKMELSGKDLEGLIKPLCVIKEKDIFGLESLGVDKDSKINYSGLSDACVYMTIKTEEILNEAKNHPAIMPQLFEIQNKMLTKFQRLWMMS